MLSQNNIRRISIPAEEFGTYAVVYLAMTECKLKRARKSAFKNLEKILKLYNIISSDELLLSVARGLTADGTVTIEVTTKKR